MKVCSKCGEEKELDLFGNMKNKKDGKDSYCKECRKQVNDSWKERNKEMQKKYQRDYQRRRNNSSPNRYIVKEDPSTYIYDLDTYKEETAYVYLIKENLYKGRIKIGRAKNIEHRFISLKNSYPCEEAIEIIFKFKTENAKRRERELHMIFAEKRVHAEWFELEKNELEFAIEFLKKDENLSADDILEGRIFDRKSV